MAQSSKFLFIKTICCHFINPARENFAVDKFNMVYNGHNFIFAVNPFSIDSNTIT